MHPADRTVSYSFRYLLTLHSAASNHAGSVWSHRPHRPPLANEWHKHNISSILKLSEHWRKAFDIGKNSTIHMLVRLSMVTL